MLEIFNVRGCWRCSASTCRAAGLAYTLICQDVCRVTCHGYLYLPILGPQAAGCWQKVLSRLQTRT